MAGQYKCSNCALVFDLGSDHLEDPNGDIAWLSYVYCEICGTNLRIFCTENEYTVEFLRSPTFQNEKDELVWKELFSSQKKPDLKKIQCQNCNKTGTIREDLANSICPICHMEFIELEYFEMT